MVRITNNEDNMNTEETQGYDNPSMYEITKLIHEYVSDTGENYLVSQ